MLRQAFLNLALNACQAMPNGGTLRIRCEARARPARADHRSPTPASASSPSTCSGFSTCTSRPRRRAAASACRWCIARCRCTTARLRYSQHQARARRSGSCCRKRKRARHAPQSFLGSGRGACRSPRAGHGRLLPDAGADRARDAAARRAGAAAAHRRGRRDRGAPAARARRGAGAEYAPAPGSPRRRRGARSPPGSEPPKSEPAATEGRPAEEPRTAPPTTLQTTPVEQEAEVERTIRTLITQAATNLGGVNPNGLNADARTQYDQAKRFISQAEDALRAKNLVFARTWPTRPRRWRLSFRADRAELESSLAPRLRATLVGGAVGNGVARLHTGSLEECWRLSRHDCACAQRRRAAPVFILPRCRCRQVA